MNDNTRAKPLCEEVINRHDLCIINDELFAGATPAGKLDQGDNDDCDNERKSSSQNETGVSMQANTLPVDSDKEIDSCSNVDGQDCSPIERTRGQEIISDKHHRSDTDNDIDGSNDNRDNLGGIVGAGSESSTLSVLQSTKNIEWHQNELDERLCQLAVEANPMLQSRLQLVKRCKQQACSNSSGSSAVDDHNEHDNATLGAATFCVPDDGNDPSSCMSELEALATSQTWTDRIDKNNQLESVDKNNNNNSNESDNCESYIRRRHITSCKKLDQCREDIKSLLTKYRCSEFGAPRPNGFKNLLKFLFRFTGFSDNLASSSNNSPECQLSPNQSFAVGNSKSTTNDEDSEMSPAPSSYGTSNQRWCRPMSSTELEQRQRPSVSRRQRDPNSYSRLGQSHYQKLDQQSSFCLEFKRFLFLLVIVAVCGVILWKIYEVLIVENTNFLGTVEESRAKLGEYREYAVSTDAKPCAKLGRALLAKGGHAVDAAIGTLFCMGVVLPNSLGLGGGCLMTIYDNVTKQATVIDGREEAPDYAHENMFSADNPMATSRGPLSVGVPGELAAYWEAHKRFGRLKWSELFDESIRMAEEGEPTVGHMAYALRDKYQSVHITPPLRSIYWNNATGAYLAEGEILKQPALAQTLRRIRDNGVDEFYKGKTGAMLIDDLQKQGGKITMQNLSRYRAKVRNATVIDLNSNLRIYSQPVPGSGIVLAIILRIMHELGYYHNEQPKHSLDASALFYHHLMEAYKFAYAQRGLLEDQPDDPERMTKLLAKLTSKQFIKQAVSKIRNDTTLPLSAYGDVQMFQADHGTAHVSVIDSQGNSIGVTTSVNAYFGSGLVSPRTGIVYNDLMDDFVSPNITNRYGLLPSKFNRIRAGRRPLSSMAPSVFVDGHGNPTLVIGASGGAQITTAIALVSIRNMFINEDIKTAIDGPRIHHQYLPEKVWFERNFAPELLGSLVSRNHALLKITGRSSVVMAIACEYRNNGTEKYITANSDYRKGGSVDGL